MIPSQLSKSEIMVPRAQGCMLGALLGDAAGATLEFLGRKPSEDDVDVALSMHGGGVFRLAPGQITDDGELTMALARAIAGSDKVSLERVACHYRAWLQSEPFDVGGTTQAALEVDECEVDDISKSLSDLMTSKAAKSSPLSKANGALMRATPLGIWSTRKHLDEVIDLVRAECRLTHPNLSCQWANVAYVVAIRHLLLNDGDSGGAISAAVTALSDCANDESLEVLSWLEDAKRGDLPPIFSRGQSGFVRIAFTHAFFHLLKQTSYVEALRIVLAGGGDSDTNACIVGGLVGARVGLAGIPDYMRSPVLECDTVLGRVRPKWLQTKDAMELSAALVTGSDAPMIPYDDADLPKNSQTLELNLSFRAESRAKIERGFLGDQDTKWSMYFVPPLLKVWRLGINQNIFTIHLTEGPGNTMQVAGAWYTPQQWCDAETLSELAESMLSNLAGDWGGGDFQHRLVQGRWTRKKVMSFTGTARSIDDVDAIAKRLREEILRMQSK